MLRVPGSSWQPWCIHCRCWTLLGALGVVFDNDLKAQMFPKACVLHRRSSLSEIIGRSWARFSVPRRSWALLGVLGRSLGAWGGLGAVWALLGTVLAQSWGAPGRSWGVLGRSWAALGASWGDPKSIKKSIRNLIRKEAESRRTKMAQTVRLSMFQS